MKLAILGSRGIPALYGGFETFAEKLSSRLAEKGIDVTVYCENMVGDKPEMYKGVRLAYIPSPNVGPLTTILFDLRCLWHSRKGFDVVYMLGYGTSAFCFIPKLWGTEVWINMDGIEWARAKWNSMAKLYFKIMETIAMLVPDRLIADADGIRQFLQKRHRQLPACSVIPYGADIIDDAPDTKVLVELDLQPNQYYLIVCRLEPENHVMEIIEGFLSSKNHWVLTVVGDDNADTAYLRQLKSLRANNVRFIGPVYDDKLTTLRYYCRAYFHGHSVGGTNPSLLEALGCGNIVIAHDNVFNREVAEDSGLYFKTSEEIPYLINKVENLSKEQRIEISVGARRRIKERYDWNAVAAAYQKILE